MRWTLLLLAALGSGACSADCGPASQLDGLRYKVFGSFLSVDSRKTDVQAAYGSPANGSADWEFVWSADAGQVTVIIDKQQFDGTGEWDAVECGEFQLRWDGEYVDDADTSHLFEANGAFVIYGDRLDALVSWNETWRAGDRSGRITGKTQLRGEQYLQ